MLDSWGKLLCLHGAKTSMALLVASMCHMSLHFCLLQDPFPGSWWNGDPSVPNTSWALSLMGLFNPEFPSWGTASPYEDPRITIVEFCWASLLSFDHLAGMVMVKMMWLCEKFNVLFQKFQEIGFATSLCTEKGRGAQRGSARCLWSHSYIGRELLAKPRSVYSLMGAHSMALHIAQKGAFCTQSPCHSPTKKYPCGPAAGSSPGMARCRGKGLFLF